MLEQATNHFDTVPAPPRRHQMRVDIAQTGRLPAMPHFFSTVVTRQGAATEVYYELTGVFHGRYQSSPQFKVAWQHYTRVRYSADVAVTRRVQKVLRRAKIVPVRMRYVATVHLLGEGGDVRAMRHVVQAELTDQDVEFLLEQGMLRVLYDGRKDRSDKYKATIYGLTPLQNRVPV